MPVLLGVVIAGLLLTAGILHVSAEAIGVDSLSGMLRDGDLIFQESQSRQSGAIRAATGSKWTHMAIVVSDGSKTRILEAGGKGVAYISLTNFVTASNDRHIAVKRLKNAAAVLTAEKRQAVHDALMSDLGKSYDTLFEWSDKKIYCSELVWKAYNKACGVSIGEVQTVRDLSYQKPEVEKLIEERFNLSSQKISRSGLLDEKIITPVRMFSAPQLETVFDGKIVE
ncbi:MAG: YiiX/YebB-like N1pC/P60 family cysteine hydrolase [Luteolibacter sp.]|uniref:YiiX/YebB-like N1pC/P60 family cysteine hydrolase n=1 Tax=Luteolibacter sp. TaxID=1962973 RepID=UPI0032656147